MTTQTQDISDSESAVMEDIEVPDAPGSMPGMLGRKIGMTTVYDDSGRAKPVTMVEVGPCVVTQVKTEQRDGYEAVQVGFLRSKKVNMPLRGHFERAGSSYQHVQEFKVSDLGEYEVGQELRANVFAAGDVVKVTGVSKGKGFQGTVKRHGFAGGPKTHGQSDRHRAPGSVGAGTFPGRVWPGTRMAGHMGDRRVTTRGLSVAAVDATQNYVLVTGSVPGARNGLVRIEKQG